MSRMRHDDSGGYGKASRPRQVGGNRPMPYDPQRDKPHHHDAGAPEVGEAAFDSPQNALKVASNTDVRALAQTITEACHSPQGELPTLLTIGVQSINQAVKGVAAAAAEVKSYGDLTFQPAFRHVNRTKPLIAFYLARQRPQQDHERQDDGEVVELTATATGKIIGLAGAIAGKVRERKRTHLIAIGAEAVTNAVLAVGNARLFLEQNRKDIKICAEFTKIIRNGNQVSAIKMNVIPEDI